MKSPAVRKFYRLSVYTLSAVYFLILVGGIVRSTGSGMGCPDWPTCFGRWIPPTSISQLPDDYKKQNAAYREKKNRKFASYLSMIGFSETAEKIVTDKSILAEADFNATKTWVEYINRLVGVMIGLFIIALFIASWKIRMEHPELFRGALAALILVIFQGWFGSIVVSTNLTTWTITVHMYLALLLVALLVWLSVGASADSIQNAAGLRPWLLAGMAVLLVQIFLGTQVRETIDILTQTFSRAEWISRTGTEFLIHRSFSWIVLITQVMIWFRMRKTTAGKPLTLIPFLLVLLSVISGTIMALAGVPPYLQPLHLLLAVITFGVYYWCYLISSPGRIATNNA